MRESKRESVGILFIVLKTHTFFDGSERRAHGQVAELVDDKWVHTRCRFESCPDH